MSSRCRSRGHGGRSSSAICVHLPVTSFLVGGLTLPFFGGTTLRNFGGAKLRITTCKQGLGATCECNQHIRIVKMTHFPSKKFVFLNSICPSGILRYDFYVL